jgi:hypothetical protein
MMIKHPPKGYVFSRLKVNYYGTARESEMRTTYVRRAQGVDFFRISSSGGSSLLFQAVNSICKQETRSLLDVQAEKDRVPFFAEPMQRKFAYS